MGPKSINLTDVRKRLPTLVDDVARTKRAVIITRHGVPVAQLAPYVAPTSEASVYGLRHLPVEIADDFDAELSPGCARVIVRGRIGALLTRSGGLQGYASRRRARKCLNLCERVRSKY